MRRSAEDELDVLVQAEPQDGDQLAGVVHAPLENGIAAIVLPLLDDCFQPGQVVRMIE